jgi:hypothetical protein
VIEKLSNGLVQHFTPATAALVIFLLTQAGLGLVWVTRQETRLTTLEVQSKAQQQIIDRLGTVEHEFDLRVTREAGIIRSNVENLRSDLARAQEQQQRIIQALDSQNNLLQEHLRSHPR